MPIPIPLARRGAAAATAAGAAWGVLGFLSLVTPDPARYLDVLFVVPFTLTLGGVVGFHAAQRRQAGRLGRVGVGLSALGTAVLLVAQVGLIADADALKRFVLPVGLAAWVLGLVLLGIATVRARVFPARYGAAIALSQALAVLAGIALSPISPLSDHGDYSGALAHGLIWLAIGRAIRGGRVARTDRPALHSARRAA